MLKFLPKRGQNLIDDGTNCQVNGLTSWWAQPSFHLFTFSPLGVKELWS